MGKKHVQVQGRYRLAFLAIHGLLGVAVWGTAGASRLEAQAPKPLVLFGDNPKDATNATRNVSLRPNTTQPFYLWVQNPTNKEQRVTVRLLSGNPPEEVAKSGEVTVPADKMVPLTFGKPAPAPAGSPAAPLTLLQGPSFHFQLVLEAKGKELARQTVSVNLLVPSQYVRIPDSIEYDGTQKTLTVGVEARESFSGPPCRVQLVLLPQRIPGLIAGKRTGVYSQELKKKGERVYLVAKKLEFRGSPENGLVYLTVDGYNRAFIYEVSFDPLRGAVQPQRLRTTKPSLRLLADRYTRSTEKFPVSVEVDNAPSDVVVELACDKAGIKNFSPIPFPPGDREQHVRFSPTGPEGAMVFKTEVRDWTAELDLKDVLGPVALRARLLDRKGKEIEVLDNQKEAYEVRGEVIVDDTPPEDPQFIDPPAKLTRGAALQARARAADPESGIQEVNFFVGRPTPDGNIPPEVQKEKVVKGRRREAGGKGEWSAKLPLPTDIDPVPVTAQFVNGVGQKATATISIAIEAAPPPPPPSNTGTIRGTVTDAGDRAQPGHEVILTDEKGARKDSTTSGDDGKFTFEKVPPGKYTVTCEDAAAMSRGSKDVTVEAGKEAEANITLQLR